MGRAVGARQQREVVVEVALEHRLHIRIERVEGRLEQLVDVGGGPLREREAIAHGGELVHGPHRLHLLGGAVVVPAHGFGHLGQVAPPGLGHERRDGGGGPRGHRGEGAGHHSQPVADKRPAEVLVERGHAVIVEAGGDRAEHGKVVEVGAPLAALAAHLTAHLAEGVLCPPALELVDRHRVGQAQHVDLLELRSGAVLGGHHVQGDVGVVGHRGVALADPGRLDHDEVGAAGLAGVDQQVGAGRQLGRRRPRGHRPDDHAVAIDGVHADAVAEERPTGASTRRIDGEHGDAELVLLVEAEPEHQLVGERGLARSPGPGDPEDGDRAGGRHGPHLGHQVLGQRAELDGGEHAGQAAGGPGREVVEVGGGRGRAVVLGEDHVHHGREPQALSVGRGEDADAA